MSSSFILALDAKLTDDGQTPADWRVLLADAARAELDRSDRGLLLSRVPGILRDAGFDIGSLLGGQKLATFLATHGAPVIQIVQNDQNLALWAVLPADFSTTPPMSQYFPPSRPDTERKRVPQFHPSVWRCFATELPVGLRRWIDAENSFRFCDLPEVEERTSLVEVEREFVRTDNLFRSNDLIAANIERWAARHAILISKLIVPERKRDNSVLSGDNVLVGFLGALTQAEQSRILLPADIVARLLNKYREH